MSFFPLDREIRKSSLWATGSSDLLKVWLYLLLEADPRSGVVSDAEPAIAMGCNLDLSLVSECLTQLEQPDEYSRSETQDGRRIQKIRGGWRILNYRKYANKDHSTPRVKRWRERQKDKAVDEGEPEYPRVGDKCACCRLEFQTPFKRFVVLDHNHETGQLRAYICQSCNKLVGQHENGHWVRDGAAQHVTAYLKRFETVSPVTETTDKDKDKDTDKEQNNASTAAPSSKRAANFWWDPEQKRVWGKPEAREKLRAKWVKRGFTSEQFQRELGKLDRWLEDRPQKRREGSNFANRINNWLNTALANLEEKSSA